MASAIARRVGIERAEIEYLVIDAISGGRRQHFTTRLAAGDQIDVQRGDDEGVIYRDRNGNPLPIDTGVEYTLTSDKNQWRMAGGDVQPDYYVKPRFYPLRMHALGLTWNTPLWEPDGLVDVIEKTSPADSEWLSARHDGCRVVSRRTTSGRHSWWFSAEDSCPTRVMLEHEGGHWEEARARLGRYGEIVFPEVVEYYRSAFKGGREPYQSIIVESARFDEPDLPRKLTPADIEVDAGMHVIVFDQQGKPREELQWDGAKLVKEQEFERRRRAGDATYGPIFLANLARLKVRAAEREAAATAMSQPSDASISRPRATPGQPGSTRSHSPETPWEAYTRRFINRFRLDTDQAQKALLILTRCQEDAANYLAAHRAEIANVDREADELGKLSMRQQADKLEATKAKREALLKPLNAIFEQRLKPQLDKLPTREQRKAAGADTEPK